MFSRQRAFGLEYEIGFADTPERTAINLMAATGQQVYAEGYTHRSTEYWKIVPDRSVQVSGRHGAELVSPKMQGSDALARVRSMLNAIDTLPAKGGGSRSSGDPGGPEVNSTTGHHVHLDASRDLSLEDVKKIAASFFVHEDAFDVLMPPSRQGTENKYVKSHRARIGYDDETVIQMLRNVSDFDELNRVFCPDGQGGASRYYKLNLTNLSSQYTERANIKTIEFRQHSATWEAHKSVSWIELLLAFVEGTRRRAAFVSPLPPALTPAQKLAHLFESIGLPTEMRNLWWGRAVQLDEVRKRSGAAPRITRLSTMERRKGLPGVADSMKAAVSGALANAVGALQLNKHPFVAGHDAVRSVHIRSGALIDQITFKYGDAKERSWPEGRAGGSESQPFFLNADEYLVMIEQRKGDSLDAVRFHTSKGRKSMWYGNTNGGSLRPPLRAPDGTMITGLRRPNGFCPGIDSIIPLPIL